MFYGIPKEKHPAFQDAIAVIKDLYPDLYGADMLITMGRNLSFRNDELLMKSFQSCATNDQERSLLWRLHVLSWTASNALNVEGDFVECGVFEGFCSAVLCKYLNFDTLSRTFYLYDTFAGLPEKTSTESERQTSNYKQFDLDKIYKHVLEVFSAYQNVEIIKGIVPDTFQESCPDKIAFLHIDMNSEHAEILALEYLFDRVVTGGLIILDDFGWSSHLNQNKSQLSFMKERQHQILELPTGQGLILKHA